MKETVEGNDDGNDDIVNDDNDDGNDNDDTCQWHDCVNDDNDDTSIDDTVDDVVNDDIVSNVTCIDDFDAIINVKNDPFWPSIRLRLHDIMLAFITMHC